MRSPVTQYDEELVGKARRFVQALDGHPEIVTALSSYNLDAAALERGRFLVAECERAFEWERAGKAWNYLEPTPDRRVAEAHYWYRDARRRYKQACFRAAEAELARRGAAGLYAALTEALAAYSPGMKRAQEREYLEEIIKARGERPFNAPMPKDTAVVQLCGWYERWSLAAIETFRHQPETVTELGLAVGKAPPQRLRNKRDILAHSSAQRHLPLVAKASE
jgi:hypothetical protein